MIQTEPPMLLRDVCTPPAGQALCSVPGGRPSVALQQPQELVSNVLHQARVLPIPRLINHFILGLGSGSFEPSRCLE